MAWMSLVRVRGVTSWTASRTRRITPAICLGRGSRNTFCDKIAHKRSMCQRSSSLGQKKSGWSKKRWRVGVWLGKLSSINSWLGNFVAESVSGTPPQTYCRRYSSGSWSSPGGDSSDSHEAHSCHSCEAQWNLSSEGEADSFEVWPQKESVCMQVRGLHDIMESVGVWAHAARRDVEKDFNISLHWCICQKQTFKYQKSSKCMFSPRTYNITLFRLSKLLSQGQETKFLTKTHW